MGNPAKSLPGAASESERQLLTAFDRETLQSERLRSTILAIGGSVTALSGLLMFAFLSLVSTRFERFRIGAIMVFAVSGALVLYELLARHMLGRKIVESQWLHFRRLRYLNVITEITLPSLLVFGFMHGVPGVYGLLMPPAYFYFVPIALSALRLDFTVCLVTGLLAAGEYFGLWWYATATYSGPPIPLFLTIWFHHFVKATVLLGCGVLAGIVTSELKQRVQRSLRLHTERNKVTAMFGQYVSAGVVNKLLEQRTELGGELRQVCVLFLDIRNFTQFAEQRSPQEVVTYLNTLFEFMIEIINKHHGFINKFLGDGFMALFGAPISEGNDCAHAVAASLEILACLDAEVAAGRLPATRLGIGIHYGQVLTGSIGSHRRKEYTIIGDTVNLAARIEQLTKQYNAQLIASASVVAALSQPLARAESLGPVAIRGRQQPLELFRLA